MGRLAAFLGERTVSTLLLGQYRLNVRRNIKFLRQSAYALQRGFITGREEAQCHTAARADLRRNRDERAILPKCRLERKRSMGRAEGDQILGHAYSVMVLEDSCIRPRMSYMLETSPTASWSFNP